MILSLWVVVLLREQGCCLRASLGGLVTGDGVVGFQIGGYKLVSPESVQPEDIDGVSVEEIESGAVYIDHDRRLVLIVLGRD